MLKSIVISALVILSFGASSQEVDKLRLGYDEKSTLSEQTAVTVSNNGKLIAFAYADKTIKIVNAESGKATHNYKGVHESLFEFRFNVDGSKLISVGEENNVAIINAKSGIVEHTFDLPKKIARVAVSRTDDYVAFGTLDADVYIYDLGDGFEQILHIEGTRHHVSGLDFDPKGDKILVSVMSSIRKGNPATIYNIKTGNVVVQLDKGLYLSAEYNLQGDKIILSAMAGLSATKLLVHDVNTGVTSNPFKATNWTSLALYTTAIEIDNHIIASSIDKAFDVINISNGEKIYTTKRDKSTPMKLFTKMGIDKKRIYPLYDGKSFLVNYSGNNVNQIFNIESGNISAFLYSDSNNDFVTIARDGRIDGNAESIEKVYWTERKSNKKVSLEATFDKYYTPRLLPALFSGETVSDVIINIEEDISHIPGVELSVVNDTQELDRVINNDVMEFSSAKKRVDLQVSIDSLPEYASEIKLYHNGKLIGSKKKEDAVDFVFPVNLNNSYGSKNFFFAVAINENGIESPKSKLIISYESNAESKPKLYALIVGINEYKNPRYQLNYALSDAQGIEEVIASSGSRLFESHEVSTLYDHEVTKDNLKNTLSSIGDLMNEQDLFLFYYAGHGVMNESDEGKEFFLVPYDIVQLYGNSNLIKEKGVSASEIREISLQLNAQKQVFIIDACQSAGALESARARGAEEERSIAQLARSTGTFWLTAAGSEQFATEFEQLGHGVFTYSLLEALSGKDTASASDGSITIRELSSYVEQRVPELSEEYKGKAQYPASFSFGNDFPIKLIDN